MQNWNSTCSLHDNSPLPCPPLRTLETAIPIFSLWIWPSHGPRFSGHEVFYILHFCSTCRHFLIYSFVHCWSPTLRFKFRERKAIALRLIPVCWELRAHQVQSRRWADECLMTPTEQFLRGRNSRHHFLRRGVTLANVEQVISCLPWIGGGLGFGLNGLNFWLAVCIIL